MADCEVLKAEDITFSPLEQQEENIQPIPTHNLDELEKVAIEQVIQKHNGNISQAAKELGLTRGALYRRLDMAYDHSLIHPDCYTSCIYNICTKKDETGYRRVRRVNYKQRLLKKTSPVPIHYGCFPDPGRRERSPATLPEGDAGAGRHRYSGL